MTKFLSVIQTGLRLDFGVIDFGCSDFGHSLYIIVGKFSAVFNQKFVLNVKKKLLSEIFAAQRCFDL